MVGGLLQWAGDVDHKRWLAALLQAAALLLLQLRRRVQQQAALQLLASVPQARQVAGPRRQLLPRRGAGLAGCCAAGRLLQREGVHRRCPAGLRVAAQAARLKQRPHVLRGRRHAAGAVAHQEGKEAAEPRPCGACVTRRRGCGPAAANARAVLLAALGPHLEQLAGLR